MQENNLTIATSSTQPPVTTLSGNVDYAPILHSYNLEYTLTDYYLQVGVTEQVQGWILHVSAIITQVPDILHAIIPTLVQELVPFKLVMDKEMARNALDGNLGLDQLGKLVSIYPPDDVSALKLAKKIVQLTQQFKGPDILTDIHLGGTVFTRYGSIKPITLFDADGKLGKYIYNKDGELIRDPYAIPFELMKGISWPFSELSSPTPPQPKKVLKHIYKPLFVLKSDARGSVYKGLYLKGFLRVSSCVIKEGRKYMGSEDADRNMYDRLKWQYDLHTELAGHIPLPKIFDFFQEDGNTYLVMEFIKGVSLYDRIKAINFNSKCWLQLTVSEKTILLDYVLKLIPIINTLHEKGYVHRDIAPGNFLLDKRGQPTLIDIELTYSIKTKIPSPPFEYGTPGFISPEQQNVQTPTPKEDIYGIGSVLVCIFTGISPIKFDTKDPSRLYNNLIFFTGDEEVSSLITSCLASDPSIRPELSEIKATLEKHRLVIQSAQGPKWPVKLNLQLLKQDISSALIGLTKPPILQFEDHWYSRLTNIENLRASRQKEYIRYGGLHEGIGGVLYLLARAKGAGFNIDFCETRYIKGWEFINQEYFNILPEIAPGLYGGAAGMAVSLAEGIRQNLVEDTEANRNLITQCLALPNSSFDIASGLSGQGVAIIRCAQFIDENTSQELLLAIINTLLNNQQKDGSWISIPTLEEKKGKKKVGFGSGIAGITWFLLEYALHYKERATDVHNAVSKSLMWLLNSTNHLKDLFNRDAFNKILGESEKGDERKGIILTFIKAYEVLNNPLYKTICENALLTYPAHIVKNNFTLDTGLAGLGEIYLEAFRILNNNEWKHRADWIANFYTHTFIRSAENEGHWLMEESYDVTADLMTGVSGVIHFLLRCFNPDKVRYRILG